ncbi:acyl-CoA dehydrogenase family protein [Aeribacillus composti]|uniref:acyl-CoA dehydrogenase family protein n=1 Tax=Aeribacillus composti TaxID=1868734 RepID=UPI002E203580|nr:acyl-CoA dehydrogenase family protein [Aeribacillus composti]MED0744642.1 acyl-CoA dehydrogenase family protein [Aeribacillus composti]
MSIQNQLNEASSLTFNGPVKVDSPELDQLIDVIAKDAEERRNAGSEELPYHAFDLIRQSRLGALRLPVELGGGGASIRDLFYVLIRLAEADPDVAHSLRAHYWQVEEILRNPDKERREQLLGIVAKGDIIGNAFTEISSKNVGHLIFETTLTQDGEGYRLNGTKYFSTGTIYSDWVIVMASTPEGKPVSAFIPTNRDGVIIEDDWDGIGQKLTGSGTTRLNNVYVNREEVTFIDETKTPFNSFLQLYLQGVIAGILRNVVADAKALVHGRSRTFTFASADTPAADPLLQQIIGQLSSSAFAAEALVLAAADALDIAVNEAVNGEIDFDLSHEASLRAAQAKVIIDHLALQAATLLFEVGGASATRQSKHFDRHWRNIRTLASHNPIAYKARAIGDYVVNGTKLPIREVYF